MAHGLHWERLSPAGSDRHIDVGWVRCDALNGANLTPKISADDTDFRTVIVLDFRNVECFYLLLARGRHLLLQGEVRPQTLHNADLLHQSD